MRSCTFGVTSEIQHVVFQPIRDETTTFYGLVALNFPPCQLQGFASSSDWARSLLRDAVIVLAIRDETTTFFGLVALNFPPCQLQGFPSSSDWTRSLLRDVVIGWCN